MQLLINIKISAFFTFVRVVCFFVICFCFLACLCLTSLCRSPLFFLTFFRLVVLVFLSFCFPFFLRAFAELRTAAISLVMSVCSLSVRVEQLGSHLTDFDEI